MDKRSLTSSENGKLGGRPKSTATILAQQMREELVSVVQKEFKEIYQPQIEKAKAGDYNAYKDLMDRVGVKVESGQVIIPIQVNIDQDRDKYS